MRAGLVFLWAAVAAIVLFVAGVFGALVLTDRISFGGGAASPAATSAAPTVEATIDPSYSVLILNAGPDDASLETARGVVIAGGWAETSVSTAQADQRDFEKTTVYYVQDADEAAALGVAQVIGTDLVVKSDASADASTTDKEITVVLGADFGS